MANNDWIDVPIETKAESNDWQDVPLESGWGDKVLSGVGMVGKAIDAYGGDASTRAAIYAAQTGKPVMQAFTDQYGNSEGAPTGKQIAMQAGVPDQPFPDAVQSLGRGMRDSTLAGKLYKSVTPQSLRDKIEGASEADVAGLGVEMAASPLNLLPAGKPIVEGLSQGAEFLKNSVKTGAQTVGLDKAIDAAGRGAAKVGELISGVPVQDIKTYATRADDVKKLMNESGWNVPEAADMIREKYQGALRGKKTELGQDIEKAIESSDTTPTISTKPIIQKLEMEKNKLNDVFQGADKAELDKIISKVHEASVPEYFKEVIPNALKSNPSAGYSRKILNMVDELTGKDAAHELGQRGKNLLQFLKETLEGHTSQATEAAPQVTEELKAATQPEKNVFQGYLGAIKSRAPDIERMYNRVEELKKAGDNKPFNDILKEALAAENPNFIQKLINKKVLDNSGELEKMFQRMRDLRASDEAAGKPAAAFSDLLERAISPPAPKTYATRVADPAYQAEQLENFKKQQAEYLAKQSGVPPKPVVPKTYRDRLFEILEKSKSDPSYKSGKAASDAKQVIADQSLESLNKLMDWANELPKSEVAKKLDEKTNVNYLNMIKNYLQNRAKTSYMENGQIFQTAPMAANISKKGAGVAREILNREAPAIAKANEHLSEIHKLDEVVPERLIAPGKPEAGLLAAGSGMNERHVNNLKKAGELTGQDFLSDAQLLSAGKRFYNPSWSPVDTTGKAVYRAGVGGGLGAALAHMLGIDPKVGAVAGAASTSPAALKLGMDTARGISKIPGAIEKGAKTLTPSQFKAAFLASKAARLEQLAKKKKDKDKRE